MNTSQTKSNFVLLTLAAGSMAVTFIAGLTMNNTGLAQQLGPLQTLLLVFFVIWHGVKLYGVKGIAAFFVISQVVSNAMENLSISTGFPFGNYHYSSGGLPFLWQVPLVIGIAYFVYGYLAWIVAKVLLGAFKQRAHTILLPLTAAFVMVMWDVVMDPINSTIKHYWIWEEGGGYNGVPLTNYLGWFLTVYLFYQLFAVYARVAVLKVQQQVGTLFWATPVLLYAATGISFVLMYLVANPGQVADVTGHIWDKRAIYETAAIASLFTMVFVAFLAFAKLPRSKELQRGN